MSAIPVFGSLTYIQTVILTRFKRNSTSTTAKRFPEQEGDLNEVKTFDSGQHVWHFFFHGSGTESLLLSEGLQHQGSVDNVWIFCELLSLAYRHP